MHNIICQSYTVWKLLEFSLTHFWQKFCENNGFLSYFKELIWRNIFRRERKFLTFPHCVIYQILREIDFWDSQKYKIYRFFTFRGSEFWCLWNFALFDGWNLIYRIGKIQSPIKWHKMALSQLLNAPKLISRKIWRKEKSCNFLTVIPKSNWSIKFSNSKYPLVGNRVSNSDIEFRNSEIEFQYRFRNSIVGNSGIFEDPKFAKFGQNLGNFDN